MGEMCNESTNFGLLGPVSDGDSFGGCSSRSTVESDLGLFLEPSVLASAPVDSGAGIELSFSATFADESPVFVPSRFDCSVDCTSEEFCGFVAGIEAVTVESRSAAIGYFNFATSFKV
jgi:hypothetical protein